MALHVPKLRRKTTRLPSESLPCPKCDQDSPLEYSLDLRSGTGRPLDRRAFYACFGCGRLFTEHESPQWRPGRPR